VADTKVETRTQDRQGDTAEHRESGTAEHRKSALFSDDGVMLVSPAPNVPPANPPPAQVAPGFHLTPEQITAAINEAMPALTKLQGILQGSYPPEQWPHQKKSGLGPATKTYALGMAAVLTSFGAELGKTQESAATITTEVGVANAIEPLLLPLTTLGAIAGDIWAINMKAANTGAGDAYRRAAVVAKSDKALAKAIEPFRNPKVRAARKAAAKRKENAKEKAQTPAPAAPAPEPAETAPSPTTTTTTTVR
jgi:hypothetical protein